MGEGVKRGRLGIIACNSGRYFAERIFDRLKKTDSDARIVNTTEQRFANGEVKLVIEECIRGDDVYIVQTVEDKLSQNTINDNLIVLFTAIDAARRSDAKYISVIIPLFPYSRQEKQKSREAITASIVAQIIEECGANNVITLDVHAEAIAGFFRKAKFFNLFASRTIIDYIKDTFPDMLNDLAVVSPDAGGVPRARYYAKIIGAELALIHKERNYKSINKVERVTLVGDVNGKNCLIVDDMIDTGGTLANAAVILKQNGAKEVYIATSLPLFNGECVKKIDSAYNNKTIKAVIATDAIYHGEDFKHEWYHPVTIAPYFAEVIHSINRQQSVSMLLSTK